MNKAYINIFKKLKASKNKKKWSDLCYFKAPEKPFLLLSVMDLIDQGLIRENKITLSPALIDMFDLYYSLFMKIGFTTCIAYPFVELQDDAIWNLIPVNPDQEIECHSITSLKKLNEVCKGASFRRELYPLMMNKTSRETLRKTLIDSHFSEDVHHVLYEQSSMNYEAFQYRALN